jgi:predicted nucleic acid-binding protein
LSSGYLVDTSVVSALAPGKPPVQQDVASWLRSKTDDLFLPSIALAEIEQGICKLRRQRGAARADALTRWLDELVLFYGRRLLPFDAVAARMAGQMSDKAVAAGQHPGFADIAIAAIAAQHTLVILTRNVRHFAGLGVVHLDPFEAADRRRR